MLTLSDAAGEFRLRSIRSETDNDGAQASRLRSISRLFDVMVNMKKILMVSLLLLCWATLCAGQETGAIAQPSAPDIGGKWVLDTTRSHLGRPGNSPLAGADVTMVIEIKDVLAHVSRTMIVDGKESLSDGFYYTDSRGESNPVFPYKGSGEFRTTSKMVDSKLVTTWTQDIVDSGKTLRVEAEESWDPLRDGKTLVNSISTRTPKGTETFKLYYKRVS